MELLASEHYVARHADPPATNAEDAIKQTHAWNDHKRRLLASADVRIVWERSEIEGWLSGMGHSDCEC